MRYLLPVLLSLSLVSCLATSSQLEAYNEALAATAAAVEELRAAEANPEITQAELDALIAKVDASASAAVEAAKGLDDAAKADAEAIFGLTQTQLGGTGLVNLAGLALFWWLRNKRSKDLAAKGEHPVQIQKLKQG